MLIAEKFAITGKKTGFVPCRNTIFRDIYRRNSYIIVMKRVYAANKGAAFRPKQCLLRWIERCGELPS